MFFHEGVPERSEDLSVLKYYYRRLEWYLDGLVFLLDRLNSEEGSHTRFNFFIKLSNRKVVFKLILLEMIKPSLNVDSNCIPFELLRLQIVFYKGSTNFNSFRLKLSQLWIFCSSLFYSIIAEGNQSVSEVIKGYFDL